MDEQQLAQIANSVAGHLDWVISFDGDGQLGSGMIFAGATVGTTLGPATVCLAPINNVWVAELTQHIGSVRANEPAQSLVLQTTGDATAADAWKSLIELAGSAASLGDGLAASNKERGIADRLQAVGLVGVDFKVGPAQ